MLAHGEEQVAVLALRDAAAEVVAARQRAVLAEDDLDVVEPGRALVGERCARERGTAAAGRRLGEAEVDRAVAAVVAIEHDVVQSALAAREHPRHAGERGRELAVLVDDAHAPRFLGDQHAAVGQEGQRPRIGEPARDRFNREVAGRGREGLGDGRDGDAGGE